MENEEYAELLRLRAENAGLKLKVQDLESLLRKIKKNFDQVYSLYKDLSGIHTKALSLLESYAELPDTSNLLGKLDSKLGVFFPNIAVHVKDRRRRKNQVKITIVDGSLYGNDGPDLDIKRIY